MLRSTGKQSGESGESVLKRVLCAKVVGATSSGDFLIRWFSDLMAESVSRLLIMLHLMFWKLITSGVLYAAFDAAGIICGAARVCVTLRRPSVCPSRRSTAVTAADGFAAEPAEDFSR